MMLGKCEKCGTKTQIELHHLFSQSKTNKKLYGELIHNELNIQKLCFNCHHNKPVDKLTEIEFCILLKIIPRSKTGQEIWKRLQWERKEI